LKSEYRDEDTLGTQILATQEEHEKSHPVEAMELAHEGGKSYMRELINVVEAHRYLVDEYYIHVFCTKERMFSIRQVILFRFFARLSAPAMHVEQDLWYVNNMKDKLELLWSLPQEEMIDIMLNDPETDKDLKKWMEIYRRP